MESIRGPWVRPKESMRYLAMSEIHVTGPQRITERLPLPGKNFQDMRVIAYPMPVDYDVTMAAQITSQPESPDTKYLTDGDSSTRFTLAAGQTYTFDLTAVQPFTARSLVLCPDTIPLEAKCQLQVREGEVIVRSANSILIAAEPNPYKSASTELHL